MQTLTVAPGSKELQPQLQGQSSQSGNWGEPIIQVSKVSKRFGKNEPTVRDLNFEVRRGQIFCLLGPSGSGKSTTMRMLTGVYKPSEGELRVLGYEPWHFTKRARTRMGYMPQQFVLFPELTTLENMNFVASVYGMSWLGRRQKVREALEFVSLWEAHKTLASQLSGGMQRRLELAATLVHKPELIFVDEPTAGIDPILRAKFWEHFKSLSNEGRTLFVTTQYVTEADYCDVVAILNRGRMLAIGTPESIRREAMGGEIIDLTLDEITTQAVRLLRALPDMRHIRIMSTEDLRLTVGDATETLREILTLFEQQNINIQSIQPYRPDFEEVFVQLMENDNATQDEENGDEPKDKSKKKPENKAKAAPTKPEPANNALVAPLNSVAETTPTDDRPQIEQIVRRDPPPPPEPAVRLVEPEYNAAPEQFRENEPQPIQEVRSDNFDMPSPLPAFDTTQSTQVMPLVEAKPTGAEPQANPVFDTKKRITQPLKVVSNRDSSQQVQD